VQGKGRSLAEWTYPLGYTRNDRKELIPDAHGEPEQAKALLAILIADMRVNSRAEVLPTYYVGAPTVCAPTSSVELAGLEPATFWLPARRSPN
jgi:hypothetical protein